jgi:hypothetical protein
MGLREELRSVGKRKAQALVGESSGEGDSSFLPRSQRSAARSDWPSVVIEAGHSQSEESLRVKAGWWLRESNFDVKVVLLIKMHVAQRRIVIEKWQGVPPIGYQGPVTRSRSYAPPLPPLEPRSVQRIDITRAANITDVHPQRFNPASYNVAGGNLQIEFDHLFLRPAQPPREADIVLDVACLQRFAVACWETVHV